MKIKPASILVSIQSREAQWTQAPDRDTDTLPRITGHGPVRSMAKASVVSRILGWFDHRHHHSAQNSTTTCTSEGNDYIFSNQYVQLAYTRPLSQTTEEILSKFTPHPLAMCMLESFK